MSRVALALLVALLLAPSLPALALTINLSDAVVLRGYVDSNADGAPDTITTPGSGAALAFPAPDVVRVDDSAAAADGNIAVLDATLVPQLAGAVIVRVVDVNGAGLSFTLGDTASGIQTDTAIVWYDGSVRIWVPGVDYVAANALYVIPSADGAVYEVYFTEYTPDTTLAASGSPDKTFQGQTPPEQKYKLTLSKGDKVTIELVQASGDNDVYVFKPSNPNYSLAETASNQKWYYYSSKADVKLWWPKKQIEFTAPEDGDYLIVVVPFKTGGSFQLNVYIEKGSQPSPMPVNPPAEQQPAAAESGPNGNKQAQYLLIGAGVIVLVVVAVWLVNRLS